MHDERQLALIDADRRRLVRAATRLLGPADAEDAVQDAYLRALEADVLVLDAAQAWLLTVVRRLAIDRLRRRDWMQQWLAQASVGATVAAAPSAEMVAALAGEAARALRLLARQLTPADGAAVLLHEVFEVGHAEIAGAGGRSEGASRQQLRRALWRLRERGDAAEPRPGRPAEREPSAETVFRVYLQSLRLRDPQPLWALLREPSTGALAGMPTGATTSAAAAKTAEAAAAAAAASPVAATGCAVVQVSGQLRLVLTLDGITLCVLPLGVQAQCEPDTALP